MKTKSIGLSVAIALLVSLFSFSAVTAMVSYPPDEIRDWVPEANHASYWENEFGSGWECVKVSQGGDFTTKRAWDAIVIKNDQRNFVWKPAPAGHYTTDKGVSHWFKCTGPNKPPKPPVNIVMPKARILQPCGDPMGGGIYNNKRSTRSVTFNMEVRDQKGDPWISLKRKTVRGGTYFVTRAYYLEPNSWVRIRRGNGEVLAIERVADAGNYGWGSWECRVLENRAYLND